MGLQTALCLILPLVNVLGGIFLGSNLAAQVVWTQGTDVRLCVHGSYMYALNNLISKEDKMINMIAVLADTAGRSINMIKADTAGRSIFG